MLSLPLSLAGLLACNTITGSGTLPDPAAALEPTETDPETTTPTEEVELPLAGDVRIDRVSLLQGVESVLVDGGEVPNTLEMPVIIGRPGQLRVFLEPDPDFEERELTAVLELVTNNDGTERIEHTKRIDGPSRISDPGSTFNFSLEGDQISRSTEMHVEILEASPEGPGGGTPRKVVWDSEALGGLDTDNTDELRIVLIPVRYNADGSGRLPDTSAAQVQRIEDLMMGVYPATNVVVEVAAPFDWNRSIGALDQNQWTDILQEMNELRDRANEPPNTYYYGLFEPSSSLNAYCSSGCILGLSFLGYTATDPYFRASVGVGYTGDLTAETLAHEVGHAHGRDHAPCGVTGDRNYPYDNARLGTWGYSVVDGELFDPNRNYDMMSYCTPYWISDYTMYNLYERMNIVATQSLVVGAAPRTVMRVVDGVAIPSRPIELVSTEGVPRAVVELFDAAGQSAGFDEAAFFPYDHVDGGMLAFDAELPEGWTAEVVSFPERQ
jgi:hypothetical protein